MLALACTADGAGPYHGGRAGPVITNGRRLRRGGQGKGLGYPADTARVKEMVALIRHAGETVQARISQTAGPPE